MTRAIDVTKRLNWIVNQCVNHWHYPAHVKFTARGVPYVQVGESDGVRVVIFAKTRKVRVFYTPQYSGVQKHLDFPMEHGDSNGWVEMVCAFATGAAEARPENS